MSRSLHTQKLERRAERRLQRPRSKRRTEGMLLSGRLAPAAAAARHGRIIGERKPPKGLHFPVTPCDIRSFLRDLGPATLYGIRSIRFRAESAVVRSGIVFAEYVIPGEIHIYALPVTPWRLPFTLGPEDITAFAAYGARVKTDRERERTEVLWTAGDLRRYLLHEVLAHELGHHLLQYHKGKLPATICRRADHELRAELESRRTAARRPPARHASEESGSC